MADDIVQKRRTRAGQRGAVTKKIAEVETLLSADEPDLVKLAQMRSTLEEKRDGQRTLDEAIAASITVETDLVDEIYEADRIREDIGGMVQRINAVVGTTSSSEATPSPVREATPSPVREARTTPLGRVKLPRLTLHKFDGEITKWNAFWDSYDSAVHSNRDLSEIEKFTYLKSLLERSAKEAIDGLSLSAANYKQAVETLTRRFGNKDRIVAQHMEPLLALEGVSSTTKIVPLRRLYDKVEANVRSLQALGITSSTYGNLLCPVLLKKLPAEIRAGGRRAMSGSWITSWRYG